jgi:hypothetical protein
VDYDITLWIRADATVMSRIMSVSYTLPAPLPTTPVVGGDAKQAFCYRQTGTLPFQDLFVLGGAFAAATAVVDLGDGQPFEVSAQPGESRPPTCTAHHVAGQPGEQDSDQPSGPIRMGQQGSGQVPQAVPMILVPDVSGLPSDVGQATLEGIGFKVQVVLQASDEVEKDKVIGTRPAAGTKAKKGSTVKLLVSTGAELPLVPDVRGETQETARALLEQSGYGVKVLEAPSTEEPGAVVDQDPQPGTRLAAGSTVTIFVAVPGP